MRLVRAAGSTGRVVSVHGGVGACAGRIRHRIVNAFVRICRIHHVLIVDIG